MLNPKNLVNELNFERTAGSENEKKGRVILTKYLKQLGYSYEYEPFELYCYEPGKSEIHVDGKTFFAYPFGLTESAEIGGELAFMENPDELIYNSQNYQGKIIIGNKYSRQIGSALKKSNATAFISIGQPFKDASTRSYRQKVYEEGYVPCLSISFDEGAKLSRLSGKMAKINIEQKVEKMTTQNVIVDIPGTGDDRNIIYAVAHFDTVGRAPGATDNTGGSVTLIKLAEYLAKNPPKRNVKLIWFSGEEMGLLGSQAYVKKHLDEIKEFGKIVVNVDVTGDDIGHNRFAIVGTEQIRGYIDGISREKGFMFDSHLDIYSSDNMPFSKYEVPSVNLMRFGGKASTHIHTKGDHARHVSRRGLDVTINATINIVERITNAKIFPFKKEIDPSMRDKIQKYLWNLTLTKPELEWTPKYQK
ncbi:MAG: M28 family metallopeptidase [Candidatus Cloacimonadota bacterium]|nr:M28 family metallopeptidase [Candidatus Cloacimonadota bacterium]